MLNELRNQKGKSQAETAADMGVPRTAVSKIEHGRRRLSIQEVARLAHAWNLNDHELATFVRAHHDLPPGDERLETAISKAA